MPGPGARIVTLTTVRKKSADIRIRADYPEAPRDTYTRLVLMTIVKCADYRTRFCQTYSTGETDEIIQIETEDAGVASRPREKMVAKIVLRETNLHRSVYFVS
jgi:hypothetical protein